MTKGKSVLGLFLLCFLILVFFASAQAPEQGVTDSAIRIGILSPLSGPDSSVGRNFLEGIQTFFSHVNDIGGIHERRIVLLARDEGQDPDQGAAAVGRMLAAEGVFAIVSASGLPTIQAIIDRGILTEDIPVLACGALSQSLFSSFRRNIFVFGMPYGDQITLAIEYLLKKRPGVNPRMGLLSQDGFLGEEVREGFQRVSKHYGLEIAGEERYGPGTYDFAPFVNRLWSAQADHIVLGTTTWEAIQIMREAAGMGWFPQFIGPSSTAEPEIMVEGPEGTENYLVVDYLAKPWEKVPGVALMVGNTQKYYPRKNTNGLHRHHVLGYVSGLLMGEALLSAGRELTREAFIDAFERIHNLNTHGLAGVIDYDTDSRLSRSRGRVFRLDRASGRFLPLTDWSQPLIRAWQ